MQGLLDHDVRDRMPRVRDDLDRTRFVVSSVIQTELRESWPKGDIITVGDWNVSFIEKERIVIAIPIAKRGWSTGASNRPSLALKPSCGSEIRL